MRGLLFLNGKHRDLRSLIELRRHFLKLAFQAPEPVREGHNLMVTLHRLAFEPDKAGLEVVDSFFAHNLNGAQGGDRTHTYCYGRF
jgi:hypothetical protein